MNKNNYIIEFQNGDNLANAGTKAPADITYFLENNSFKSIYIKTSGFNKLAAILHILKSTIYLCHYIKAGSNVVVQYPIYSNIGSCIFNISRCFLKRIKKCSFIGLAHDIKYLRTNGDSPKNEIDELNKYSKLIVHSPEMRRQLISDGVCVPCFCLGLFDYRVAQRNTLQRHLSKDICFAGNLKKSAFLYDIEQHCSNINGLRFYLYGKPEIPGTTLLNYCGAFSADDLSQLKGSWGLVWDGPSSKQIIGNDGTYQKYNSPHKASLYLCAGLPLIASSESAIANIIKDNNLGFCISSINDIEKCISNLSDETYQQMIDSVSKYAERLTNGKNIVEGINSII